MLRALTRRNEQHPAWALRLSRMPCTPWYKDIGTVPVECDFLSSVSLLEKKGRGARQQAHYLVPVRVHLPHWPIRFEGAAGDQKLVVEIAELPTCKPLPKRFVDGECLDRCIGSQAEKR